MKPAISISHLKKYFGSTKAVDDISFSVEAGEIFGFLGPNGAGKTTTIRCLMDLYRPISGTIEIFGFNANTQGLDARRRLSFMPAVTSLNEKWTAEEHFAYAQDLRGTPGRSTELANRLNLDPTKKIKHLSTGNRQKVSLVLAFMFSSDLIILDEPTNGLDPLLQQTVYELVRESGQRGATVLMSSHNLAEVERTCSRVAVLRSGKLVAIETMSGLRDKHLYTVSVQLSKAYRFPKIPNAEVASFDKQSVVFKVSGDIQPMLKAIAAAPVHDVQIQHASLEELFLEFYNQQSA